MRYTVEEKMGIENLFDTYMKRSIKRALSRIIQKLVNDNELVKTLYKEDMDTLPSKIVIGNENEFCVKGIVILIKDEKLSNILNMLHTREREVILLNIGDDIPLDEVSRILDINYNTVRLLKKRGLQRMEMLYKNGV